MSEYADNDLWVAVPAYTVASGVAFARVRGDAHFLSDVFVGATFGVVVTKTIFGLEQQRRQHRSTNEVALLPFASGDARGLRVMIRF